jgi:hypothetical protein
MDSFFINISLKTLAVFQLYFIIIGFSILLFNSLLNIKIYQTLINNFKRFLILSLIFVPFLNIMIFLILCYIVIFESHE